MEADPVTPLNFEAQFSARLHSGAGTTSFQPANGLFFCQVPKAPVSFNRTWIFDADDTLWEDNVAYVKIKVLFFEHVASYLGPDFTLPACLDLIDAVEHETIAQHGFGAHGFAVSIRESFRRLNARTAMPEPTELIESIVPILSSIPTEIPASTLKTLRGLRAKGDGLILFTQGPIEIQQGKIARSRLAPLFHGIAVASNKLPTTYKAVIQSFSTPTNNFIVVGNSLKSEIIPAIELGLKAYHFMNPNSWAPVNASCVDKNKYSEISDLVELLELKN